MAQTTPTLDWVTPDPSVPPDVKAFLYPPEGGTRLGVVRIQRDHCAELLGYTVTWDPPEGGWQPNSRPFRKTSLFPSLLMARHYAELYGRLYMRRYLA
jgi:hypothetical protein